MLRRVARTIVFVYTHVRTRLSSREKACKSTTFFWIVQIF